MSTHAEFIGTLKKARAKIGISLSTNQLRASVLASTGLPLYWPTSDPGKPATGPRQRERRQFIDTRTQPSDFTPEVRHFIPQEGVLRLKCIHMEEPPEYDEAIARGSDRRRGCL